MLAVADLAGGKWPDLARRSAVALVADTRGRSVSLGVTLLRDLRAIFTEAETDKLSTETILEALIEMDESPWGDLRGKPLDARGLSRRLAKYDIKPKNVRIDGKIPKGYEVADLADSWARYLAERVDTTVLTDTPPRYVVEVDGWSPEEWQESATAATPLHPTRKATVQSDYTEGES